MRRLAAVTLCLLFALPLHAGALSDQGTPEGAPFEKVIDHTFQAPVPCAAACPYWVEPGNPHATCHPDPIALGPPAGSYDDWDFRVKLPASAPAEGIVFFVFALSPTVDHDGWMCLQEAHPDNPGRYFIETSANQFGVICGAVPMVGCAEKAEINVCVDKKWSDDLKGFAWGCTPSNAPVTFRSYNWGDPVGLVPAWVCWSTEGIKPDGKGCAGAPVPGR